MKNITLAIDEKLLEESREYARKHRTSVNAMIRRYLQQMIRKEEAESGVEEVLRMADRLHLSSRGWKWKREDAYDV